MFAGLGYVVRHNVRGEEMKIILTFSHLVLLAFAVLPTAAAAEENRAEAETKTGASAEGSTLGRLFYTPEQRIQLDRLRGRPGQAGATVSNTISVNGIVQRKGGGNGSSVVWINGVPQSHESADGLLAGRNIAPDAANVKVPGTSKSVRLKVGQTLDLNSGAVSNVGTAPSAGKDVPTGENEQARPAGQVDSPAPQPVQGSKDKAVLPYGKTE